VILTVPIIDPSLVADETERRGDSFTASSERSKMPESGFLEMSSGGG
jgi:hypothetical protein